MNRNMTLLRSLCVAALALPLIAVGQESKPSPGPNRIVIKPDGLPEPYKTPSVQNRTARSLKVFLFSIRRDELA